MLILMLMSGLFTPVSSMPEWAQVITLFQSFEVLYGSECVWYTSKEAACWNCCLQIGVLFLFALGFNTWAVISYRKNN